MAEIHRIGDLDISEDPVFQRREWHVQRIGWVVILLVLILGLAGVFGNGVFSDREQRAGRLALTYERVARKHATTELRVRADATTATDETIRIWLGRAFLDAVVIEWMEPEPVDTAIGEDRLIYRFALADPARPAVVTIAYEPVRVGKTPVQIGIIDGDDLTVGQFVLP